MIIASIPYLVLVMSTVHVYSVNILYVPCPKMKIMLPLCLEWPGKEAYMPKPDGGAVKIDWQLLSPVTPLVCRSEIRHITAINFYNHNTI